MAWAALRTSMEESSHRRRRLESEMAQALRSRRSKFDVCKAEGFSLSSAIFAFCPVRSGMMIEPDTAGVVVGA